MSHLTGKRILVTQSEDFMGPALCLELATYGAEVIADSRIPIGPNDPEAIIDAAGPIDVLILNLALPAPSTRVTEIEDEVPQHYGARNAWRRTARPGAHSWHLFSRWVSSSLQTTSRSTQWPRILWKIRPTSLRRYRPTHDSRKGSKEKFHWGAW